MPNRAKQKGDRAERLIVDVLRSYGLDAYRIPLSGAATGFKSDVEVRLKDGNLKLESKVRARGFTRLYKWLEFNDALIVKGDRCDPLIVLDLKRFARLIAGNSHNQAGKGTDKPLDGAISGNPLLQTSPALTYNGLNQDRELPGMVRVNVGKRTVA